MDTAKTHPRIPLMPILLALVAISCMLTFGAVARYSSTTVAHTLLSITATGPFWAIYEDDGADTRTLVFTDSYPQLESASYGSLKDYGFDYLSDAYASASEVPWLNSDSVSAQDIDYAVFESTIAPASSTAYWFYGCSALKSIGDAGAATFARLDTSAVTDMTCMLYGCSSLTYIDLSGVSTAAVVSAANAFGATTSLSCIQLGSSWSFKGATGSRISGLEFPAAPDDGTYEGLWYATSGPNLNTTYTEHEIPDNVQAEYSWSLVRALTLDNAKEYG